MSESQGINADATTRAQEEDAEEIGKEWYYALTFLMESDSVVCSKSQK